jgi:hypothetical protein
VNCTHLSMYQKCLKEERRNIKLSFCGSKIIIHIRKPCKVVFYFSSLKGYMEAKAALGAVTADLCIC